MLGLLTGLMGAQAIAATTVAVERVVLWHLEQQISVLAGKDPSAIAAITSIVQEEQLHHNQSESHLVENGFWYRVLSPMVSTATEVVIWLGMRVLLITNQTTSRPLGAGRVCRRACF